MKEVRYVSKGGRIRIARRPGDAMRLHQQGYRKIYNRGRGGESIFFGGKTRAFRGTRADHLNSSTIVPNDLKLNYTVARMPVRSNSQSCTSRTAEKHNVCGGTNTPGMLTRYLQDLSEKLPGYNGWTYFQQINAIDQAVKRNLVNHKNIDDLLHLVTQCIDAREAVIQDCYSGETDGRHLHVLEQLKALRITLQEATAGNRWARSLAAGALVIVGAATLGGAGLL